MSADRSPNSNVALLPDIDDLLLRQETSVEFAWLLEQLHALEDTDTEPPVDLLESILAELEQLDRSPWHRVPTWGRVVAYAGAVASAGGAVVWASVARRRVA